MTKEEEYKEVSDKIAYLFDKIDFGKSFLDAKAIRIMNNLNSDIRHLAGISKEEL